MKGCSASSRETYKRDESVMKERSSLSEFDWKMSNDQNIKTEHINLKQIKAVEINSAHNLSTMLTEKSTKPNREK